MAQTIMVDLDVRSYPIFIEHGVLDMCAEYITGLKTGRRAIIITNDIVSKWYLDKVYNNLTENGFDIETLILPDGEKTKSMEWLEKIYHEMLSARLDRHSIVIALGGGVVGDLSGFAAATYMRGIPYIQVPTTLLSQVDSSVGGKTGINLKEGKNLVGAFYQPMMVLIDPSVLSTLDARQLKAGFAEVIKYGIIWDQEFFCYLEENLKKIMKLDKNHLEQIISTSCRIKADVVGKDERESALRAILNFGHTVGHAIEAIAGYETYVHGEAVAMGMIAESYLGTKILGFDDNSLQRIKTITANSGLPYSIPENITTDSIIEHMYYDKKVRNKKIRIVIPEKIGKVQIIDDISESDIAWALEQCRTQYS